MKQATLEWKKGREEPRKEEKYRCAEIGGRLGERDGRQGRYRVSLVTQCLVSAPTPRLPVFFPSLYSFYHNSASTSYFRSALCCTAPRNDHNVTIYPRPRKK